MSNVYSEWRTPIEYAGALFDGTVVANGPGVFVPGRGGSAVEDMVYIGGRGKVAERAGVSYLLAAGFLRQGTSRMEPCHKGAAIEYAGCLDPVYILLVSPRVDAREYVLAAGTCVIGLRGESLADMEKEGMVRIVPFFDFSGEYATGDGEGDFFRSVGRARAVYAGADLTPRDVNFGSKVYKGPGLRQFSIIHV